MTEIKKTLAILKARWPEVTLIVGLSILALLLNKLLRAAQPNLTPKQSLLALIPLGFVLAVMIISTILNFGFQRTVYLEGKKQQQPMVLLKTGKHFFWRMVKLGLLLLPIYCILIWLTFLVTKQLASIETGYFETAQSFPLVYQFCFIGPSLILVKPLLLVPALVIVLDCQVLESFKYLKKYRLFDARGLLMLFLVGTIFSFSWVLLPKLNEVATISHYMFTMVRSIIGQFITLMVAVTAIRFVASLDLVYDSGQSSSDPEDSSGE